MSDHSKNIEVQADSKLLMVFLLATGWLFPYAVFSTWHSEPLLIENILALLILPCIPYGIWISTYVVKVYPSRIVVTRAFGLIPPIELNCKYISEFRIHCNTNGQMTRFEIWSGRKRVIQLHMFQSNFGQAVNTVRLQNPNVPAIDLPAWKIW